MIEEDRNALIEALARALAFRSMTDDERATFRRRALRVVEELEAAADYGPRVGRVLFGVEETTP